MRYMRPLSIVPAFALLLAAASASAASGDSALGARLDTASAREQVLQDRIAADDAALNGMHIAALFGESDEEKAAREQHEQNQDQGIANLNQRVGDVENSLTRLTGQVEQLDHRIQELNARMERMQKDFDYKLCQLSAQQLGASTGGDTGLPCGSGATSGAGGPPPQVLPQAAQGNSISGAVLSSGPQPRSAPPTVEADHAASGAPQHLAPGPGVLGSLPSDTALPLPPPEGQGDMPAPTPAAVFKPEFDKAMNLLARAQYDQALAAFQGYADKHPDDALAPQALYWVGDIYYVQRDYVNASRNLALGIKKYPNSVRAPDSMLKMAEALIAMDRKKEGCTALGALPAKYPNASKAVATKAAGERKALCGK